jgi:HEAT repeat protein
MQALWLTIAIATTPANFARIVALLHGIDNRVGIADLKPLSTDVARDLQTIADDAHESLRVRGRAMTLLAQSADARAPAALITLLHDATPEVRIEAVEALRWLPAKEPAVGLALQERLGDVSVAVRLHVVNAMADRPALHRALAKHLLREQDAKVRDLIGARLAPGGRPR